MTICPFCSSDNSGTAVVRCGNCGKSLVSRAPGTAVHRAQPGQPPKVFDRDHEEREARRVGIIAYTVMGIIALGLIMFMAPHVFGLADRALSDKDVEVGLSDFDVVDAEENGAKTYNVNRNLVLHLVVMNKGQVPLKRLDANITVRSKDMTLANVSGQTYTLFHLVKPEGPVMSGASVPVDVKFPLLHAKAFGYVQIEWDIKLALIE